MVAMPRRSVAIGVSAAAALLFAACMVDFEEFDFSTMAVGAGGASTASGGQGGATSSATAGGTAGSGQGGGAGGCGVSPPPPGGTCPAICNGGCNGNICHIECSSAQACQGNTIDCPSLFACELTCNEVQSCRNATLNCPDEYACTVICEGLQACESLRVNCSQNGVCALDCNQATEVCLDAHLECGDQKCTATCATPNDQPNVDCNQSCDCTNC